MTARSRLSRTAIHSWRGMARTSAPPGVRPNPNQIPAMINNKPSQVAKLELSERAIIQRINRRLAKEYERLCTCRYNSRGWHDLGNYYVIDTYRNAVIHCHITLEDFAREL